MKRSLPIYFLLVPLAFAAGGALDPAEPSMTRVEQSEPAVTFSGNWYSNVGEANSGGSAALTNSAGARVVITFDGTGITWIGLRDPWSGLSTVYLDGTGYRVDSYADETQYQQALFSVRGLASGPHTLSIEVTHERGPSAQGSWVWIDAFDVENGAGVAGGLVAAAGRTEQNSPILIYSGTWKSNTLEQHSGAAAVQAVDAGSSVTIGFRGTGITWVGYQDEWSGIARVYLDGALAATVDTFASPSRAQSHVFSVQDLPSGNHTLMIEATGTRNASSGGASVWLDAFDVQDGSGGTPSWPPPVTRRDKPGPLTRPGG